MYEKYLIQLVKLTINSKTIYNIKCKTFYLRKQVIKCVFNSATG